MPFRPGENVGPYRIIEQLGQGGMATVFKAYHPALDRHVAIKAMHPAFLEDPQFQARFEREARVVASLDHPNIVPIYDFAQHGGQPYLVMKFVEGQTLKAVLDQRSLNRNEILHVVKAVGAALGYAHKRGVLHRDIKPSNVLLTPDGQIYLADFGLARMAEAGQSSLSGDQLLGTPHYISPEQARGERDLDQGTDIYSLGIVLYQLTVGRVPFDADTPFSIIHDHIYTPLPMPRATHPEMPEALQTVLLKALAKDREARYETVDELVRAFEAAFRGGPAKGLTAAAPGATVGPAAGAAAAGPTRPGTVSQGATAGAAPAVQPAPAAVHGHAAIAAQAPARVRRWPWVLGGLALSSFCLLTFAVAASNEMQVKSTGAPAATTFPGTGGLPTPGAPSVGTPVPPGDFPADPIQSAQAAVDARPQEPEAHLELARALESAGQLPRAYQEFLQAGELYLQQGAYSHAAETLLHAAGLQPPGGQEPRLIELLTQALFLGAPSGEMLPLVQQASQLKPEFPNLAALEARSRIFLGEVEQARAILDGVLARRPEDLMAGAAMVDVLQAEGNTPGAIAQLDRLLSRPRLPDWLIKHLDELRASLKAP
jgi:serine/threonine-protein kinase